MMRQAAWYVGTFPMVSSPADSILSLIPHTLKRS